MKHLKLLKKTMLTFAFTILSFLFLSTNYSCDDSTVCEAAIEYSDLLTSLINITSGIIDIGDEVTIASQITNEGITNACDALSETAPESIYSLDFDYRPDANSNWIQSAARALISVDQIDANSSALENFNFVFQQGGDYRISGKADAQNNVIERNENNNVKEFLQAKNSISNNSNLIINVVSPLRKNKISLNKQLIKVSQSKNPKLISFKCISIEKALIK